MKLTKILKCNQILPGLFEVRKFSTTSSSDQSKYDITIVGGGIVGLATARELKIRHPKLKMCVLEKEKVLSYHQTGHNSGVIHAGIYYLPGSLKAKLCVEGLKASYKYCDEKGIKYNKCGKLIVATEPSELKTLENILERGIANNVPDIALINGDKIRDIEPNCVGLKAIHSPHTGIVDWREVSLSYGKDFTDMGGKIYLEYEVSDFKEATEDAEFPVIISDKEYRQIRSKYVITCAGLQADRVAKLSGSSESPKIIPFRGDYLILKREKSNLVRGNIYPVPDPRFPFLGVHFTPRIDGSVWLGPNAILSFKREGYGLTSFNMWDTVDFAKYSGMRKLAVKHLVVGMKEMYNLAFISRQVKLLQRFVPSLTTADVERGPSGIRAQAVDPNGNLVDDFVFHNGTGQIGSRLMHVRNAPSPAATSSLSIAHMIADKADKDFKL